MHVLVLTFHNVLVPQYGGALRVAVLLDQLLRQDIRVSVIRFRSVGDAPSLLDPRLPVRDVVVPLSYPLAPLAIFTHLQSPMAERFALDFHHEQPIDLIQSDPPWVALTGAHLAHRLGIPHVLLSQNCESTLATYITRTAVARRLPLIGNWVADFNVALLQWAEKRVVAEADLTLTPSATDRDEMASIGIPIQQVELLPNGTNVRPRPDSVRLEVRRRLSLSPETPIVIFVGRLDYPPNREAVEVISCRIAPRCPGIVFLLVGMNPPRLAWPENVKWIGFVERVDDYLSASDLTVVPITFGSGTRIKILDAWAAGLPILSTSAAAAGLPYADGTNIVIEDSLVRFPARIEELLQSPEKLASLKHGALEAVRPYRWETIGQQYAERLKRLVTEAS